MTIGLEAKGYKESETRAGKRHRNRQKVAKRDERAQELSHKARQRGKSNWQAILRVAKRILRDVRRLAMEAQEAGPTPA
jgi:hypothetical protein